MRLSLIIALVFLAAASAAPAASSSESGKDIKVFVSASLFEEKYLVYTSKHDVVSLVKPAVAVSFKDDLSESRENDDNDDTPVFFVEADFKNGQKEYKGLYALDTKNNNTVTLVLANGRDTTFSLIKKNYEVYFAADDGIYNYDAETKSAKKYGTFKKSIFAIVKVRGSDIFYVLTDDKDLYKITNKGKYAKKVNAVKKAAAIALDFSNNLYFYTAGKAPQCFDGKKVISFKNLPAKPTFVALIRPPFIVAEDYVIAIVNDKTYAIYKNESIANLSFELQVYPTAFGLDGGFLQYYAYNKKIYEYNFLAMIIEKSLISGLENYLQNNKARINQFATNKV